MFRDIIFLDGPLKNLTAQLRKDGSEWERDLGIYHEKQKKLMVYKAKTIRKYTFHGFKEVPLDEPVVEIGVKSDGVTYRDPLGRNDYADLARPPIGHPDVMSFVRELFKGGRVHLVAGR